MIERLEQTAPVREFATAIGECLLARRFGFITPLAFRWQVGELHLDGEVFPYIIMELLVNDPPPPSAEWLALSKDERVARPIREWEGRLWPREDMDAVDEAALERARALGVPEALDDVVPVVVALIGRTEAEKLGMRFPQVASEAAP